MGPIYYLSHVMRKPVFEVCDSNRPTHQLKLTRDLKTRGIKLSMLRVTKALIRLRGCEGWFAPLLFAYGKTSFPMTWLIISYYSNCVQHGSFGLPTPRYKEMAPKLPEINDTIWTLGFNKNIFFSSVKILSRNMALNGSKMSRLFCMSKLSSYRFELSFRYLYMAIIPPK